MPTPFDLRQRRRRWGLLRRLVSQGDVAPRSRSRGQRCSPTRPLHEVVAGDHLLGCDGPGYVIARGSAKLIGVGSAKVIAAGSPKLIARRAALPTLVRQN